MLAQVKEMITYIQNKCKEHGIKREIPIHILIETHGALHEVFEIARFCLGFKY
jgi:citrate lyase subunit beta/citryl-CoA lyase